MRTKLGFLGLVVVGLVIVSLASDRPAQAAVTTAATHHHHHHRRGKIVAMNGDSITIEFHHHVRGTTGGSAKSKVTETKTFKLNASTKVGFKSSAGMTAATTSDLKVGERVVIHSHDGVASVVAIVHRHKKKSAAS